MIALAVSRTALGLLPLTAADSGTSGAVIIDWQPGDVEPDNEYAESAWLDGSSLARTRSGLITARLELRLYAASVSAVYTLQDSWRTALSQFSYTVTETFTGGSHVYNCCPAALSPTLVGTQLRQGTLLLTASIPRQP